jgi:hypothetical protein
MGDVFLAVELAARRLVAVKFLHAPHNPTARERFRIEVQALARLDHPGIVRVLTVELDRPSPFFTMEYLPGGSLARRLDDGGPLPPAEAAVLVRDVARAVGAAHAADILHRDLKPGNILLAARHDGRTPNPDSDSTAGGSNADFRATAVVPKVADFGLARLTDQNDRPTLGSGPMGTPYYMPPEQVSSKFGPVGRRSDVYGLGATLYHLLTGKPPHDGATPAEVTAAVTQPVTLPRSVRPDIPPGLEAIVVQCLELRPEDRYESVDAVADDLQRFLDGERQAAPEMTRPRRLRRWAVRNRRLLAAAAVAVVLSAGLVAAGWRLSRPPVPPDPAAVILAELKAGRPVVLVGPTGPPRQGYEVWLAGGSKLAPSPAGDGAFGFEAGRPTYLGLAPAPDLDRYRFEVEIRHEAMRPPAGQVGLFVGFEEHTGPNAELARRSYAVVLSDYWSADEMEPEVLKLVPDIRDRHAVEVIGPLYYLRRPGETDGQLGLPPVVRGHVPFRPWCAPPGVWRGLAAEVTPDGVVFYWKEEADTPGKNDWRPVAAVSAHDLASHLDGQQTVIDREMPASGITLGPWDSRRPVGVLAEKSVVSIRNAVLKPLHPGPP